MGSVSRETLVWLQYVSFITIAAFGLLLGFGIVGEIIWGSDTNLQDLSPWEPCVGKIARRKKLYKVAEIAVLIGVLGELAGDGGLFFSSEHLQQIADRDLANADARLVAISPRIWLLNSDDIRAHLKQSLKPFVGQKIEIRLCPDGDFAEKADFAIAFEGDVLKSAHWKSKTLSAGCGGHGMNVSIVGPPLKETVRAARALNFALQSAGFIPSDQPIIVLSPEMLKAQPDTVVLFIFSRT